VDIIIMRDVLPRCVTWRDVAETVRQNLNPRRIENRQDVVVPNAVLWSELRTFFEASGLKNTEAEQAVFQLRDLGFIKHEGKIKVGETRVLGRDIVDWVMQFQF
jgi:hypothetical protein